MSTQVSVRRTTGMSAPTHPERTGTDQRTWMIRRARRRIESGFYETDSFIESLLDVLLSQRPSSPAGREAQPRIRTRAGDAKK